MSALEVRPYPRGSDAAGFCDVEGCKTLASGGWGPERRKAVAQAFICGRPAGGLCKAHAREWQASWGEAAGVAPEREFRAALAVAA